MNVKELWRYPVKGLKGEYLEQVEVTPNASFPQDRRFALAHGTSGITHESPKWALKNEFHMLMHKTDALLSELTPLFDESQGLLTIQRDENVEVTASVRDPDGINTINRYFQDFLGETALTGLPTFVEAKGFYFGNLEEPVVSLINLASVRQLSSDIGEDIDVRRFRGNILIDGVPPWEERNWVGRVVSIGDVSFEVIDETIRCGATVVNPSTCEHDLNIPQLLRKNYGHLFCGVYLISKQEGTVSTGDPVIISD